MIDIRKSIDSIINERLSSPFYGTLILSWLIWDWRIIYLTFFVSESKIESNKIDFILINFSEINDIIENKGKGMYVLTETGKRVN